MADERIEAEATLEDDYTEKARDIAKSTAEMKREMKDIGHSTMEANIEFIKQIEKLSHLSRSMGMVRRGLTETGIISSETADKLRGLFGAVDLVIGITKTAVIVFDTLDKASESMKSTMLGLGFAMASVGLAVASMNAQTQEQKALFSALTGVTSGLAIAEFTLALAKFSSWVAGAGPLAPIMAGIIGGALITALTYWASVKGASAQTEPGEVRSVEKTGIIVAHKGEQIGRVSEPRRRGGNVVQNIIIRGSMDLTRDSNVDRIGRRIGRRVAESKGLT